LKASTSTEVGLPRGRSRLHPKAFVQVPTTLQHQQPIAPVLLPIHARALQSIMPSTQGSKSRGSSKGRSQGSSRKGNYAKVWSGLADWLASVGSHERAAFLTVHDSRRSVLLREMHSQQEHHHHGSAAPAFFQLDETGTSIECMRRCPADMPSEVEEACARVEKIVRACDGASGIYDTFFFPVIFPSTSYSPGSPHRMIVCHAHFCSEETRQLRRLLTYLSRALQVHVLTAKESVALCSGKSSRETKVASILRCLITCAGPKMPRYIRDEAHGVVRIQACVYLARNNTYSRLCARHADDPPARKLFYSPHGLYHICVAHIGLHVAGLFFTFRMTKNSSQIPPHAYR
jgi:hypothetical protein